MALTKRTLIAGLRESTTLNIVEVDAHQEETQAQRVLPAQLVQQARLALQALPLAVPQVEQVQLEIARTPMPAYKLSQVGMATHVLAQAFIVLDCTQTIWP